MNGPPLSLLRRVGAQPIQLMPSIGSSAWMPHQREAGAAKVFDAATTCGGVLPMSYAAIQPTLFCPRLWQLNIP